MSVIGNSELKNYEFDLMKLDDMYEKHDREFIDVQRHLIELKHINLKISAKNKAIDEEMRVKYRETKIYKYCFDTLFHTQEGDIMYLFGGEFKPMTDKSQEILKNKLKIYGNGFFIAVMQDLKRIFTVVMEPENYCIDMEKCKINIMKANLNTYTKKEFSKETVKKSLEVFDYLKSIICSNVEDDYEYLLDLVACYAQNKQSQIILFLCSHEGTGKSFFCDSFLATLLQKRIINCDKKILMGKDTFNGQLIGVNVAVANELSSEASAKYHELEAIMKEISSSPTINYREMYKSSISLPNIINFVITTNYVCDVNTAGRRIFNPTVSFAKKGNNTYFENLADIVKNPDVAQYMYNFFTERKVKTPMREMINENKTMAKDQQTLNNPVTSFLINRYLMKPSKEIVKKYATDLYDEYVEYCKEIRKHPSAMCTFGLNLSKSVSFAMCWGKRHYNVSYETLYNDCVEINKLISKDKLEQLQKTFSDDNKPCSVWDSIDGHCEVEKLRGENAELRKKIEELENMLKKQSEKPKQEENKNKKDEEKDKILFQKYVVNGLIKNASIITFDKTGSIEFLEE